MAQLLSSYNLSKVQVENSQLSKMKRLQSVAFKSMSKFSKFYQFLGNCGEGLRLVEYYLRINQTLLNKDDDFQIEIGRIRDEYLDQSSFWCLPKRVLKRLEGNNVLSKSDALKQFLINIF